MADRFAGKISIGGQVPTDSVEALIDAISSEGINLHPDWADKPFSPENKQDLIDARDQSGHIVLCNDQASNGMFDCLEAELTELGISWERWSDSYCEYDAEIVWRHSGMAGQDGIICDSDGNELCPMAPVREAYKLLKGSLEDGVGVEEAMAKLASIVKAVPTLPPLKFVN